MAAAHALVLGCIVPSSHISGCACFSANMQVALQAVQAVMMMTAALLDDQAVLEQANAAQLQVGCDMAGSAVWDCAAYQPLVCKGRSSRRTS